MRQQQAHVSGAERALQRLDDLLLVRDVVDRARPAAGGRRGGRAGGGQGAARRGAPAGARDLHRLISALGHSLLLDPWQVTA
jgi:hypothetical protein